MSHLFFNHQPGATEVSGEISFTFLELLIKILKVQISTSPQESPHSCKESPLLSPPSRGSRSTSLLEKQSLPPSGAEPLEALAPCPCPGRSKVGAGGTGDPQARACGCPWSEVSSLWGSQPGQLVGTSPFSQASAKHAVLSLITFSLWPPPWPWQNPWPPGGLRAAPRAGIWDVVGMSCSRVGAGAAPIFLALE